MLSENSFRQMIAKKKERRSQKLLKSEDIFFFIMHVIPIRNDLRWWTFSSSPTQALRSAPQKPYVIIAPFRQSAKGSLFENA